jgi:serine/threonine-protein kinase RsbW
MAEPRVESAVFSGSKDQMGETLSGIRNFVTEAARHAGIENMVMHRLRLAVDEIATNIIVYGYDSAPGEIKISRRIDDSQLTISLEDTGTPFDPTQAEAPDDLDAPLEERGIGGLGIFLAINGIDDFRYERIGNSNINHFTVLRH